jgi:hypothetical protein
VYRVVAEDEAANHAGFSVWADENWRYVNLNESFVAISFESGAEAQVSPAQVRSAAMLVEMLRRRYNIPAANCVTHAQISVNPRNMRVGYHLDWVSDFPFAAVGLPDNYSEPLAAVWAYGFDYDPGFARRMQRGVENAEKALGENARQTGATTPAWRQKLRDRYRQMLDEVQRQQPVT